MQVHKLHKIPAGTIYHNSYYEHLFVYQLKPLVASKSCNLKALIVLCKGGLDPGEAVYIRVPRVLEIFPKPGLIFSFPGLCSLSFSAALSFVRLSFVTTPSFLCSTCSRSATYNNYLCN